MTFALLGVALFTCALQPRAPAQPTVAPPGVNSADNQTEAAIRRALDRRISVNLIEVPVEDAIEWLRNELKLQIWLDRTAISEEGGTPLDMPVTLQVGNVTTRSFLKLLLEPVQLTWVIRDELLSVTTATAAGEIEEARVYDVRRLLINEDYSGLIELIICVVAPDSWPEGTGPGPLTEVPGGIVLRQTQAVHEELSQLLRDLERVVTTPRGQPLPPAFPDPVRDAEAAILRRLSERADLKCQENPLDQVVNDLLTKYGVPVWIDRTGIHDEGATSDSPMTLDVTGLRLDSLLNLILRPVQLAWIVDDEVLKITTRTRANELLRTVVYDVRDLVRERPAGKSWPPPGFRQGSLRDGLGSAFFDVPAGVLKQVIGPLASEPVRIRHWESADYLIHAICIVVEPDSWDEVGGSGVIRDYLGALVIRQTQANHRKIEDVLRQIRSIAPRVDQPAAEAAIRDPDTITRVVYEVGDYPVKPLEKLIREVIAPEQWSGRQGRGTIDAIPGALVIRQTRAVHREIVDLLYELPIRPRIPPTPPAAPTKPDAQPEEKK